MRITPWPHSPAIIARIEENGVYVGHEVHLEPFKPVPCTDYDWAARTAENMKYFRPALMNADVIGYGDETGRV